MSGVVVLWGESPFLLREAARDLVAPTEPSEVEGAEWVPGTTAELATPSLFGESRALVVTEAQSLPDEAVAEVARYASDADPGAPLVLAAVVSPRAKGPPARLARPLKGAAEVRRVAVERRDLPAWVQTRAKRRGVPSTRAGAAALVETVGEDPALLDQSVEQIRNAFPEEGITPRAVAAQFRGLGDRRIWELCDAAFDRDAPGAFRHLTAMLEAREQPLAILGGVAARLRELIRIRAVPRGLSPQEAARAAGLRFDWQARRYRRQAERFSDEDLAAIHERLAEADAILKQGGDGAVVLPTVVAAIARRPAAGGPAHS